MDAVGAEVGQKMRSAIKAKLTELECYVDDELPDYIMVMVANKRSKSQMNEDLNLFLASKTTTFVEWLHIVLKKLKEVTVTNPEIYKKATKRKPSDGGEDLKVKKEKKEKESKKHDKSNVDVKQESSKSLTDDLPINIKNRLSESRKVTLTPQQGDASNDGFDIPLLADVNKSKELEDIEKQIKSVKSRLGDLVHSDDEEQDILNIKTEISDLIANKAKSRKLVIQENILIPNLEANKESTLENTNKEVEKKSDRKRITFSDDEIKTPPRKRESALSRLGKRSSDFKKVSPDAKYRKQIGDVRSQIKSISRSEGRKKNYEKESVLSRLGVMSKISVPEKPVDEKEVREVRSMITVKPRTIPPNTPQANKNLILKAVAEAQRSIAQTPNVGVKSNNSNALFTRKYIEDKHGTKLIPEQTKSKLKNILVALNDTNKVTYNDSDEEEYVPKPVHKSPYNQFSPTYTPTSPEFRPNFVVNINSTLDEVKQSSGKKSPIIFDIKSTPIIKPKPNIPDKLPNVTTPASIKKKELCLYYPNCRMGDKCEYIHVRKSCEMFPHCKFGDKCLYIHPSCKFGVSCTRRECPYSHGKNAKNLVADNFLTKSCKFGKFCKNASCKFNHSFASLNRKVRS